MPLRLSLTFSVLEGTMVAWVPPPPGNRLFISFLRPPRLVVTAKPEVSTQWRLRCLHLHLLLAPGPTATPRTSPPTVLICCPCSQLLPLCLMAPAPAALQLAGRLLKYSYHIARVSSWIEQRMRAALTKTMVFPGGWVGAVRGE